MPIYVLAAALAIAASIPILWWSLASDRRKPAITGVRDGAQAPVADARKLMLEQGAGDRVVVPAIKSLSATAMRFTPSGWVRSLQRHLTLGGDTGESSALERLLVLKFILAGLGLFLGWFLGSSLSSFQQIALTALLVGFGFFVPDALVARRGRERQEQIELEMPDTLDQLSMSVKAGLGFEAALARAGRTGSGPLADEFNRTIREIQLGIPRRQALRQLADRTDVSDLDSFVLAVTQSDQYGIPIGPVLQVQSDELRDKRRERAEERALKIPVLLIFPLAFCIFPAIFIVLLGPAAIRIFDTLSSVF